MVPFIFLRYLITEENSDAGVEQCGSQKRFSGSLSTLQFLVIRDKGTHHLTISPCSMKFFRLGRVCRKSGVPSPCWYLSCEGEKNRIKDILADYELQKNEPLNKLFFLNSKRGNVNVWYYYQPHSTVHLLGIWHTDKHVYEYAQPLKLRWYLR